MASKVSAIVSAYYAEEFLENRLLNLAAQDIEPEIVVICQQGSAEHNIAMAFDYPNIKIVVTEGIPTVYAAWNMGIEKASGKYLTNANTDDEIYTGGYRKMKRLLDLNPDVSIVYADVDVFEKGDLVGRYQWAEGGLDELVNMGCFLGPMPMWRASLHKKYGLFDDQLQSAGDYEFWMRCANGGAKFLHIREVLGKYDKRDQSIEHRLKLRALWETARARAKYRYQFEKWRPPNGNNEWVSNVSGG